MHPNLNFSQLIKDMLNKTQIHPKWVFVMTKGEPTYNEIWQGCKNTALFLPDVDAHQVYYSLRRDLTIKKNVYLGKESLFRPSYKYLVGRWVHPKVLRRVKGMERGWKGLGFLLVIQAYCKFYDEI